MQKNKLFKNRLFIYICTLYFIGLIFGIILIKSKYLINYTHKNFLTIFFSNFWYIFLIWIFGFTMISHFFTTIIVFFRGFLFGFLIKILLFDNFKRLLYLLLLEIVIAIPILFIVAYISILISNQQFKILIKNYSNTINYNKYINFMFVVIIGILVYSLLVFIN